MVIVPINTFKVGSPQVRISNTVNYLNDTATHEYIYVKEISKQYAAPIYDQNGNPASPKDSQDKYVKSDNNYYNIYDSNVDGNGKPIYIRN